MRRATERHFEDALRDASALAQCLNDVAVAASRAATIEEAIQFYLRLICDFLVLPVAHAYLFTKRIVNLRTRVNIWLFGSSVPPEARRAGLSERSRQHQRWYARILKAHNPFVCRDVDADGDFPWKQMSHTLSIKSALVVPILFHNEVTGALEFFSCEPMRLEKVQVQIMRVTGGRVGYIIDNKRAQRKIQKLSRTLVRLQYDERRRLSQELHDTTAQNLAAIVMNLGVIEQSVQALDSGPRSALLKCISLARQSLQEIRTFSFLLHPPMFDELGLVSALRIYFEGFSQRSGMRVDFSAPDHIKLPTELQMTLFHIVQEGLTNAYGHSSSPWANVRMTVDADEVSISVENKTTAPVSQNAGVGLRSMQERVQQFGGRLAFHSDEHRTVLAASLPLSRLVEGRKAQTSDTPRVREPSRILGEAPELRS